jgi:EAL domain-containing protein (putative c-di-GMP-specific phosphodiesterase class I)/ActR/RegA family two-component response regulator
MAGGDYFRQAANRGGMKHSEMTHPLDQRGVLVVEDSTLQLTNLCSWLRALGLNRIYTSGDGQQALELVASLEHAPSLLILDLELPLMDGIELLQHLHERQVRPAVVVLSSADESLISAVAIMVEALGFPLLGAFRKPFSPAGLSAALEKFQAPVSPSTMSGPKMQEPDAQQLALALEHQAIKPYFQPKLDLQLGCLAGVEALARWQIGPGQFIPPGLFIPLADKSGLIDHLTLCMLDQVLAEMAHWRLSLPVALNLSGTSLGNRTLTQEILQRVSRSGLDPRRITFEITESAVIGDLPTALASISRLRLKGFGFSIDDYGTGFSSMQQLSRFPFTELKIDRSFVQGAVERESVRAILQSAVDMGRRLGINTVAEGVETPQELQLLRQMGCRQVQGYWFARPMAASALHEWLGDPLQMALRKCLT